MKASGTVLVVVASLAAVAWGQSLEELAQKEKARRKAATTAKTFTNDDLAKPSPSPSPTDEAQAPPSKGVRRRLYQPGSGEGRSAASEAPEGTRASEGRSSEGRSGGTPTMDDSDAQAYWRDRAKAAEAGIRGAQNEVEQAQAKIKQSRKGMSQPLPIEGTQQVPFNPMLKPPELVEAEAGLAAANANLAEAQQAMEDLREEARRKGVPAGWVR